MRVSTNQPIGAVPILSVNPRSVLMIDAKHPTAA